LSYNPLLKENRKNVLLNLLSATIWYSFVYIAHTLLKAIKDYTMPPYIAHIGFVVIILVLNIWLGLFLNKRTNKKRPALTDTEKAEKIPSKDIERKNHPKKTTVNIKKRLELEKDRERILVAISKYPKHEVIEISKMLSIGIEVVKFHLEELKKIKFAKVLHIQGSTWENIPYREEWITDQLGREYLIHHKLIQ